MPASVWNARPAAVITCAMDAPRLSHQMESSLESGLRKGNRLRATKIQALDRGRIVSGTDSSLASALRTTLAESMVLPVTPPSTLRTAASTLQA